MTVFFQRLTKYLRITAPKGERIELEFVDFLFITTDNEDCWRQSLSLRDPEVDEIIGKYCGNTKPPNYSTMGNEVFMLLKSESIGEYKVRLGRLIRTILTSVAWNSKKLGIPLDVNRISCNSKLFSYSSEYFRINRMLTYVPLFIFCHFWISHIQKVAVFYSKTWKIRIAFFRSK